MAPYQQVMRDIMRYMSFLILLFLSSHSYAEVKIQPSQELLNRAKVSEYKISDNIKVTIGNGKDKTFRGYDLCEMSNMTWLTIQSKYKDINKIEIFAESESVIKDILKVINSGSLSSKYQNIKALINLEPFTPHHVNIWGFVHTSSGIFTNVTQARCVLPENY